MAEEPEISPEQLADFRRCRFAHRAFTPRPSLELRAASDEGDVWRVARPYDGGPHDPGGAEVVEGGWDHEHCDVCWVKIRPGDWYWPNVDEAGGHVDLCEQCYPRVMGLLGQLPGDEPGAEPGC